MDLNRQTAGGLNYNMLRRFMSIPPLGIPCLSLSAGSGAVQGALAFLYAILWHTGDTFGSYFDSDKDP